MEFSSKAKFHRKCELDKAEAAIAAAAPTVPYISIVQFTVSNATSRPAIPAQTAAAVTGDNPSDTARRTNLPDIEAEKGEDILRGDDDSKFGDDGGHDGLKNKCKILCSRSDMM